MIHPCQHSANPRRNKGVLTRIRRFWRSLKGVSTPKPRRGKPRSRSSNAEYHLTVDQIESIVRAARNLRDGVLLRILAETGLRRSEVARLRVEDIRSDESLILVRNGKGGKSRIVPMTPSLTDNLRVLVENRRDGAVFPSPGGGCISPRQVNRIVADAGRRADVSNPNPRQRHICCHLFRHSFARLWKERVGSIETLSRILGHASVKTTWDLYGREGLQDIRRNYAKVMDGLMKLQLSDTVPAKDNAESETRKRTRA